MARDMIFMDLDILSDVIQISPGFLILGVVIGLSLWLFGWRWHRFWIVLATTVGAGLVGLMHGEHFRSQPLVAAPLLALAAGVLALSLVRLLAFFAGGIGGLVLIQSVAPQFEQPLITFVVSGLVGLFLFHWCWMALTSMGGTLLFAYCGLGLGSHYRAFDALAWSAQTGPMLNWLLGGAAFLGLAFQIVLNRRTRGRRSPRDDSYAEEWEEEPKRKKSWFRRAG